MLCGCQMATNGGGGCFQIARNSTKPKKILKKTKKNKNKFRAPNWVKQASDPFEGELFLKFLKIFEAPSSLGVGHFKPRDSHVRL